MDDFDSLAETSDLSDEVDDEDAWLIDSITRYRSINMYEIEAPTRVIELLPSSHQQPECAIIGSSFENSALNDVQIVKLPLPTEAESSIHPEHDLSIDSGGFTHLQVHTAKSIHSSSCFAVSGPPFGAVEIWTSEADANETSGGSLRCLLTLNQQEQAATVSCRQLASSSILPQRLVVASTFSDITSYDITNPTQPTSFRHICSQRDNISSDQTDSIISIDYIHHNSEKNELVCCTAGGTLALIDMRTATTVQSSNILASPLRVASMDVSHNNSPLIVVSDEKGTLRILDARKLDRVLAMSAAPVIKISGSVSRVPTVCPIQVKFSPFSDTIVSLSGLDASVRLYSTQTFHTPEDKVSSEPFFLHGGHERNTRVLAHQWHPTIPWLVYSSTDDAHLDGWIPEAKYQLRV
eukprot:GILK01006811.1.p1 GENE.GILK01006811.1~~GILK01006811.1.p1  ORF type:complete len:421 (-),score=33.16 GILK01006811.1:142-1368(-)